MSSQPIEATIQSADGTPIGFVKLGTGPAVVFVHGSLSTGDDWLQVARLMSERFTCYVMDRRGRGRSGDAADYSLEREYEDIGTMLGLAGPGAHLVGHSYGAICALGVALRFPIGRLVLYEPPLVVRGSITGAGLESYRASISAHQLDEALAIGLTHFSQMTAEQIASFRQTPLWFQQAALTPTWTRELEAINLLGLDLAPYKNLSMPTLLLVGTKSAPYPLHAATAALSQILPDARVVQLHGQGHVAHLVAPHLVANEIMSFLLT